MEYFLGNAKGNAHNIQRSRDMSKSLNRIGLHDTPATRQYLTEHLDGVFNNASSVVRTQANGRDVREALLMGPNGGVKFQTIWEGNKLITGTILYGKP